MPQSLTPFLLRVCRSLDALRRVILLLVLAALASAAHGAAPSSTRPYALGEGDAAHTLRQFVEQSGEQVVYVVTKVRGVKTNPGARRVHPRGTPSTALSPAPISSSSRTKRLAPCS